ncbi:ROK family transcriptional regulator [Nonomuraea insulae]|uniref:ROK family protein n=1 Tax=Nonomuraea insulae TaxID=1616787 RepID=A0ABW1D631_9ACTN
MSKDSPGAVFALFRSHPEGLTKTEVARLAGLSRTAVNQRIEALLAQSLIVPSSQDANTGGRPADRFDVNPERGVVLIADTGATGMRVALADAVAGLIGEQHVVIDITDGPRAVLDQVTGRFARLLELAGRSKAEVLGIGLSVPGPVDAASGRVVNPPIMTGWHDYDIVARFAADYDCPVVVDKDVNAMAYGEHRLTHPDTPNIVFVKIGTGIGTGLIVDGRIYRGSDGAAGDVGHIPLAAAGVTDPPVCRCGNTGCVEAYAGGWAMVRDLRALGHRVDSVHDVVDEAHAGNPDTIRIVKRAAVIVGMAISDIVNILNPRKVVIGGQLAAIDDVLFAGVREAVYGRSLPLATRNLTIVPSVLEDRAGVHGLTRLVTDAVFAPDRVDRLIRAVTR